MSGSSGSLAEGEERSWEGRGQVVESLNVQSLWWLEDKWKKQGTMNGVGDKSGEGGRILRRILRTT